MNVPFQHAGALQHLMIVDCDIHPAYRTPADLHPFLPARWRGHRLRDPAGGAARHSSATPRRRARHHDRRVDVGDTAGASG